MANRNTFTITCYGKTKRYPESKREEMMKEYRMGMIACEGSERDRSRISILIWQEEQNRAQPATQFCNYLDK